MINSKSIFPELFWWENFKNIDEINKQINLKNVIFINESKITHNEKQYNTLSEALKSIKSD